MVTIPPRGKAAESIEETMGDDSWSNERIELLKKLWAGGATASSIAADLGGISRSAVLGKIFRLRPRASTAAPSVSRARAASRDPSAEPPSAVTASPARRRGGKRDDPSQGSRATARARGKSLLELTNNSCRWPHGRPGTPTFFFCGAAGADLERGMPYCARHARRAYLTRASILETANDIAASAGKLRAISSPAPARSYMWRPLVRNPAARWR
jgi:GcrA cell cycle regulator